MPATRQLPPAQATASFSPPSKSAMSRSSTDLELNLNLDYEFKTIEENFIAKKGSDYAASRGEYLNGIIMSHYLGIVHRCSAGDTSLTRMVHSCPRKPMKSCPNASRTLSAPLSRASTGPIRTARSTPSPAVVRISLAPS